MKPRFLFPFLAFCSTAPAQSGGPWSITSSTLDGGGAAASGGVWKVTGTTGQPDASPRKSGGVGWAFAGGFWPTAAAIPGEPMLTVTPRSATTVSVVWTAAAVGYKLQNASNLQAWTDYPGLTISGASSIVWPLSSGLHYYFRLVKL